MTLLFPVFQCVHDDKSVTQERECLRKWHTLHKKILDVVELEDI